jgi:hypothetical protein
VLHQIGGGNNWTDESMTGEIKAVDLKLVGDLFGNGYVMDFTNRTYQEFFRDEVGVDIYNGAYLIDNSNSKGKRLSKDPALRRTSTFKTSRTMPHTQTRWRPITTSNGAWSARTRLPARTCSCKR